MSAKPYSLIRGLSIEYLTEELNRLVNLWDGSKAWTVEYVDERWHAFKIDSHGFRFSLPPATYAEQAAAEWCQKLGMKHGIY